MRFPSLPGPLLWALYLVFGVLWIFYSDQVLSWLVTDPIQMLRLQTVKGMLFVGLSCLYFVWASHQLAQRLVRTHAQTLETLRQDAREAGSRPPDNPQGWRLRLLREAKGLGLWDYEVSTARLRVNDDYATMLGFDAAGWTDTPQAWAERLHPEDREAALCCFQAYLAGEQPAYHSVFRMAGRDGQYRHIRSLALMCEQDAAGRPQRIIGVHLDISAEEAARARVRSLTRLYDFMRKVTHLEVRTPGWTLLASRVTEAAVAEGGLLGAWVGERRDKAWAVTAQAGAVLTDCAQCSLLCREADPPPGSLCARVLAAGQPVIVNDYFADPATLPWREAALAAGVRAAAAFALRESGQTCALMIFYAGTPDFFDADRVEMLAGLVEDLSFQRTRFLRDRQRERAERVLNELIQSSPDWIYAKDADRRLVLVNPALAQACGLSETAMLGRSCEALAAALPAGGDGALAWLAAQARDDAAVLGGEVRHRPVDAVSLADGMVCMLDAVCLPLRDEAGEVTGVMGYARDITSSIEAYRQISAAEARFDLYYERMPIGCVVTDVEWRLIEVNPAFEAMFGYPRELALRQILPGWLVKPQASPQMEILRARLSEGAFDARSVLECLTRDGRRVLCDGLFTPLRDAAGRIDRYLIMLIDMTARADADAALAESHQRLAGLSARLLEVQELERRSLARELHDEIGQQLAALKLNLHQVLTQESAPTLAARLEDSLEIVDQTIERVRGRALALRPPVLDELGLTAALEWYCERQRRRSGVSIALMGADLPRASELAEITVFRVVQEAVNNALRHARANEIRVSLRLEDGVLALAVEDDGCGFDPQSLVDCPDCLGLSGMRERVEGLDGSLSVLSVPGHGCSVLARLPFDERGDAHG